MTPFQSLIQKWRDTAGIRSDAVSMIYARCAEQLEALLSAEPQQPVGELRDWIELLKLLAAKGEILVGGKLIDLASFLETLGDRQVMREALTLILSESGLDNTLVKGADPVVFARMGDIHQTADHALSASPQPSASTVWQPIETAPKDGRRILVIGGMYESDGGDSMSFTSPQELKEAKVAQWITDAWFMGYGGGCYDEKYFGNPTHWMPLPSPPIAAAPIAKP